MTGRDAITVRPYESEDESSVVEFLGAVFGRWPVDIDSSTPSEFFRWKHQSSPFGRSLMRVALVAGEVVGFGAYMPWRLRSSSEDLLAMRLVDFAVDPRQRGRSVTARIRASVEVPADVVLMWSNPNQQSRSSGLKEGWVRVEGLPGFARPGARLRAASRRGRATRVASPGQAPGEAVAAAEVLRDEDYFAPLVHANGVGERLATLKNLDYLRWRYGRFEEYRAARARSPRNRGVVIFRVQRHGRYRVAHVCELLVEGSDHRTARHLLKRVRQAAPVDFLSASFTSWRDAAHVGFLPRPTTTELTTRPMRRGGFPDPALPGSWALSRGDLELL